MPEEAGFSQKGLAFGAGRSPSAVDVLERGRRKRPRPHTVRALADASGLGEVGRSALLAAVPTRGKDAGATPAKDAPEHARSSALPDPATLLVGWPGEVSEVAALVKGGPADARGAAGIGGWMLLVLGLRGRKGQDAPGATRADPTSCSAVR